MKLKFSINLLVMILCLLETNLSLSMEQKPRQLDSLKILVAQTIIDHFMANVHWEDQLANNEQFPVELYSFIRSKILEDNYSFLFPYLKMDLYDFNGHTDVVTAVALNLAKGYALTGSQDLTVRLWDLQEKNCIKIFSGHNSAITAVTFDEGGKYIASGSEDGNVRVWDIESGDCSNNIDVLMGEEYPNIRAIRFLEFSENILAFKSALFSIHWDLLLNKLSDITRNITLESGQDYCIVLEGDEYFCKGTIQICKRFDKGLEDNTIISILNGHPEHVMCAEISPNDKLVITGSNEGLAQVWDLKSGNCIRTLNDHVGTVWAVGYTEDSTKVFTVAANYESMQIKLWDIDAGKQLEERNFPQLSKIPIKINVRNVNEYIISFLDGTELIVSYDDFKLIDCRKAINKNLGFLALPQGLFDPYCSDCELFNLNEEKRSLSFVKEQLLFLRKKTIAVKIKNFDLQWHQDRLFVLLGYEDDDNNCKLCIFYNPFSLKQLCYLLELQKNKKMNKQVIVNKEILESFEPKIQRVLKEDFKEQLELGNCSCIVS